MYPRQARFRSHCCCSRCARFALPGSEPEARVRESGGNASTGARSVIGARGNPSQRRLSSAVAANGVTRRPTQRIDARTGHGGPGVRGTTRDQRAIFEIDASQYLLAVGEAPFAVSLKEHDRLLVIIV